MTPSRPYLIRALYDWITDNNLTPHILVDAEVEGVMVPNSAVNDGKVTLNIGPTAVKHLVLGNNRIEFEARFQGISQSVVLPVMSVMALYARENSQGMMFPPENGEDEDSAESSRPGLRVVK
ncbi:MAG: ClpXP protease specificity-enhancing factor [Xanthomonadales bacterium]|nr:ClpXP protease specificity-enhancing factor [Xanthomonadales bacterium]